jgi:hypothetical protein
VVIKETEASMARVLDRKAVLLAEQEQLKKSTEDEALRTLEEELADLEELWPKKPFTLKESILKILIKHIFIDPMSPKFFRVIVEWKYADWGKESMYLVHKSGGRKEWSDQEKELLLQPYPDYLRTRDRFILMKALPDRSWRAIHHASHSARLWD